MRIPAYDDLRVGLNQLPTPTMRSGEVQDTASRQITAAGQGLQRAGQDLTKHVLELQQEVNDTMLMGRLNLIKEHAIELEHNQQTGFRMLKGDQALTRPDNQTLEDEYSGALQKFIDQQGEGLAPAVLSRYREQTGNMVNGLRERAMVHRNGEFVTYTVKQNEAIIATAAREIAMNPGDEKVLAAATGRIDAGIDRIASINGMAPEQKEQVRRAQISSALRGAVTQLMDDDPHKATAFLEKHLDKMDYPDVVALRGQLTEAIDRADGIAAGEAIVKGGGPVNTDFESIFQHTLKIEGGYVADDAGKGETNLGINKTANPDLNIKGMTVSKAREVYRQRYWNAIGGDSLPPQVRAIAFDAAVNHGPSFANKIIAQADGDPAKMIALRRAEYARLVRSNPGKYGKYAKSWESRLKSLEGGAGPRSTATMLAQADQIQNPKQRDYAKKTVRERAAEDEFARKEDYENRYTQAQTTAFSRPGGWADIPSSEWSQIKPEDQARLMAGAPKVDEPEAMQQLLSNPSLWAPGKIEQFRHLVTESTYRQFQAKGRGEGASERIFEATIDNNQLNEQLQSAGLFHLVSPKKDGDKEAKNSLLSALQREINAQQQARGRKLTLEEKRVLTHQLIKPVRVQASRTGSLFGLFDGGASMEKRAWQVENPGNILIPKQAADAIVAALRANGIPPTTENIVAAYLRAENSK